MIRARRSASRSSHLAAATAPCLNLQMSGYPAAAAAALPAPGPAAASDPAGREGRRLAMGKISTMDNVQTLSKVRYIWVVHYL